MLFRSAIERRTLTQDGRLRALPRQKPRQERNRYRLPPPHARDGADEESRVTASPIFHWRILLTHPPFHSSYPHRPSQERRRQVVLYCAHRTSPVSIDNPSKLARILYKAGGLIDFPLRASNQHSFTVGVLRARRVPGYALPILLRPRVARAQKIIRPPSSSPTAFPIQEISPCNPDGWCGSPSRLPRGHRYS